MRHRFFQSSKPSLQALNSFSDALLMSSMIIKRQPFKVIFILGNKKKSHGAMSGEYGGWAMAS